MTHHVRRYLVRKIQIFSLLLRLKIAKRTLSVNNQILPLDYVPDQLKFFPPHCQELIQISKLDAYYFARTIIFNKATPEDYAEVKGLPMALAFSSGTNS